MRKLLILCLLLLSVGVGAQNIMGRWKTIDDETNQPKSIVEIFERSGKVYGRVVKLFRKPNENQDPVCDECDDEDIRYKKRIIGMEILTNMIQDEDEYTGGEILDPNNGKVYRCKIWIEGKDLKLRGYLGPFYRTQTWLKAD
jgi:uncharacterized protein (DUF2147 family)